MSIRPTSEVENTGGRSSVAGFIPNIRASGAMTRAPLPPQGVQGRPRRTRAERVVIGRSVPISPSASAGSADHVEVPHIPPWAHGSSCAGRGCTASQVDDDNQSPSLIARAFARFVTRGGFSSQRTQHPMEETDKTLVTEGYDMDEQQPTRSHILTPVQLHRMRTADRWWAARAARRRAAGLMPVVSLAPRTARGVASVSPQRSRLGKCG